MIFVKRGNEMPNVFDDGTTNRAETEKIIQHYSKSSAPYHKYYTYRRPEVKEALLKLFLNKCAYCESIITNHPGDIEHFRPKNQVQNDEIKTEKPGYYWLAADWTNLYLSCNDCNRRRYHRIPGSKKKMMLGKLDQFPLQNNKSRWKNYKDSDEKAKDEAARLLLDPCRDDPEEFFSYNEDGFILPAPEIGSWKHSMAVESIRVYALQRMELVEDRKRYYLKYIKKELIAISKLKNNLSLHTTKREIDNTNEMINDRIVELLDTLKKNQPYTAMAKYMLRDVLPDLVGEEVMKKIKAVK